MTESDCLLCREPTSCVHSCPRGCWFYMHKDCYAEYLNNNFPKCIYKCPDDDEYIYNFFDILLYPLAILSNYITLIQNPIIGIFMFCITAFLSLFYIGFIMAILVYTILFITMMPIIYIMRILEIII